MWEYTIRRGSGTIIWHSAWHNALDDNIEAAFLLSRGATWQLQQHGTGATGALVGDMMGGGVVRCPFRSLNRTATANHGD